MMNFLPVNEQVRIVQDNLVVPWGNTPSESNFFLQ